MVYLYIDTSTVNGVMYVIRKKSLWSISFCSIPYILHVPIIIILIMMIVIRNIFYDQRDGDIDRADLNTLCLL